MVPMDESIRLHRWRAHLGLTLQVVATRSGLSVACCNQGETGRRAITARKLRLLVERGLKITMVQFYGTLPPAKRNRGAKLGRPRTLNTAAA